MDRLNIVQKTVMSIILAAAVMTILIPLVFFTTVSFSNAVEMSQFPKKLFPDFSVTVKIVPNDLGEYELFYDSGEGYTSIITSKNSVKLENHFARQYGVTIEGEKLLEDFSQTLEKGPMEFTYRKNIFNNFNQFFKIVPNASSALKNSIIVALYTIVRMFPMVGISIPMALLLIRFGLFDTLIGLALLYSVPNIALTAWITSSIFIGINRELEEASMVFGANGIQTFMKITLPLAFPALAASSMYSFLTAWNDTISALILTDRNQTLALVVYKAIGTTSSGIQYAAAGSIVLILPALVFTFIIRRYIGQMWGGVEL